MYERYLEKIKDGKPIPWGKFWDSIPHHKKNRADFNLEKAGKSDSYLVTFVSGEAEEKYAVKQGSSPRVSATLNGNSHKEKVSFASLISYTLDVSEFEVVLASDELGVTQAPRPFVDVIVIENKEVFFNRSSLGSLLEMHNVSPIHPLVVLGNGKEIANSLLTPVLGKASKIYCFVDYDLGGLTIFDSLKNLYGDRVAFCLYPELEELSPYLIKKPTKDNFRKTIDLCDKHKLPELKNLLLTNSRFMEQESFLDLMEKTHV